MSYVESSNIIIYERVLIPVRFESYPEIVIILRTMVTDYFTMTLFSI